MAVKIDKYDKIFSQCIRESAGWTCERCGYQCPDGVARGVSAVIQCSHVYGRRHRATRWFPDNCFALCQSCHRWVEDRPLEHAAFARKMLGDTRYDNLMRLANSVKKWTKTEKEEMYQHFKSELERMRRGEREPLVSYQ